MSHSASKLLQPSISFILIEACVALEKMNVMTKQEKKESKPKPKPRCMVEKQDKKQNLIC